MDKVILNLGENLVVLKFQDFVGDIDVDELTSIDYSNLYGEIVTASALLNKIGLLKAEAESIYQKTKLDADIYEANLCKRYRREANINAGKFSLMDGSDPISVKLTEKSLEEAVLLDPVIQNKKKAVIEAQKNLGFCDALYWAISSKDRKLNVLMKPTTPKEFFDEIVNGKINGIVIQKKEYKS